MLNYMRENEDEKGNFKSFEIIKFKFNLIF